MHDNVCSSTASASPTSASSLSFENAHASDLGTCFERDYSLSSDSLYQDIINLKAKVKSLEVENSQLREKFFSVDKLKNDNSAVYFYTCFPNVDTIMDVLSYFLPKLEHITYW